MGNSAAILVEIENGGSIRGGENLEGKVLLDVGKETSADSLIFRFYGVEETRIKENSDENARRYKEPAYTHFTEFVMHRFVGGSLAPGCYLFPFEVALPRGLAGSQYFGTGTSICSISYHCEVKLLQPGKLLFHVQNSCDVLMNDEPHASFPTPMFLGPTSCKVSFMSVNTCGMITFGGKVNTTSVSWNEKFRLDCGICNQSTAHVKALEIIVKRYTSCKAEGLYDSTSYTVFKRRIDVSRLVGAQPLKTKQDGAVDYRCVAVLEQIKGAELGVDISISNDNRPSFSGRLINVRYKLSLTVKTTFGTNNGSISIPIIMRRHGFQFPVRHGFQFPGIAFKAKKRHTKSADENAIEAAAALLSQPPVLLAQDYDTVGSLLLMVLQSSAWQEVSALKDWLAHSPHNINLLTPDTMSPLFECIKTYRSYCAFCQTLGMAMNDVNSTNKCTTHTLQRLRGRFLRR